MRFGIKMGILAVAVVGSTVGGVFAYAAHTSSAEPAVITPILVPAPQVAGASTNSLVSSGGTTAVTAATPKKVLSPKPSSPQCSAAALAGAVKSPTISLVSPGLVESPMVRTTYPIYGNTLSELRTQASACAPSLTNGERFSANTSYALNWTFDVQVNDNGLCSVGSAAVGLGLSQQYPQWQPGTNANASLSASWQSFIQNLTTHEMGHANLARSHAAGLLQRMQDFTPTDCATIVDAVNAQANADIRALDAANEHLDHTTGHGASQGAIL